MSASELLSRFIEFVANHHGVSIQAIIDEMKVNPMRECNPITGSEIVEMIPLDAIRYAVFVNLLPVNSSIKDFRQLSWRDCELLIQAIGLKYSQLKKAEQDKMTHE